MYEILKQGDKWIEHLKVKRSIIWYQLLINNARYFDTNIISANIDTLYYMDIIEEKSFAIISK